MNILSTLLGFWNKTKNQIITSVGTNMQAVEVNGVTGRPEKIATLYTWCRVLSENFSRMPISIYIDSENGHAEMKRHRLSYLLKHQPNGYQNAQIPSHSLLNHSSIASLRSIFSSLFALRISPIAENLCINPLYSSRRSFILSIFSLPR